jgi:small ligand-binding sensory domain FIST
MRWASVLSERTTAREALAEAADRLGAELGGRPDLVIAFASAHQAIEHERFAPSLADTFPGASVVGCGAGGVIGAGREVEDRPALSLTGALLPGVRRVLRHFDDELPQGADAWRANIGLPESPPPCLIVIADPFTADAEGLVRGLDEAYPSGTQIGGLASGGRTPGEGALYLDGAAHRSGAVVVGLSGALAVDTIVAQGCRAIGKPMVVTRALGNVIHELDRRPPQQVLQALYESLDERDKALFKTSLFLGVEMREQAMELRPGELLVRNLIGMDRASGALAVAAVMRPWQVVQFMLRDARTAEADLKQLLEGYRATGHRPAGALLFSCLGRGRGLFGEADHDTRLFRAQVGPVPLGGFFCNGEIGPVGGTTFLHGYTSAFGLFRPR